MNANDSPTLPLASIEARASVVGLSVRGAFHLTDEDAKWLAGVAAPTGTCVVLGFTGSAQWPEFAASSEAKDTLPNPLDRWSRRLIGAIAREVGARELYPSGTPHVPFQRLAARAESVHPSPIGLLIHPRWGLWHAYRGALLLPGRIALPERRNSPSPCVSCKDKPCLTTCPVGAFRPDGFDLRACVNHVTSAAGRSCRDGGCLARRACPIGVEFRYGAQQMRFHMEAFLRATRE